MYGVRTPLCGNCFRHNAHPFGMNSECPGCPADQAEIIRMAKSLAVFGLLTNDPLDPRLTLHRVLQVHPSVQNAMRMWGDYPVFGTDGLGDTGKWLGTELQVDPSLPEDAWRIVFDHGSITEEASGGDSPGQPE